MQILSLPANTDLQTLREGSPAISGLMSPPVYISELEWAALTSRHNIPLLFLSLKYASFNLSLKMLNMQLKFEVWIPF
jgi:hypothetical protein